MKITKLTAQTCSIIFLLIATNSPALALGTISSGGGGRGVVCRDSKHQIVSVQLLDLWEAETLYSRPTLTSNDPVDVQVEAALTRLQSAIYEPMISPSGQRAKPEQVMRASLDLTAKLFLSPSPNVIRLHNINLSDTPDSAEPASPSNCAVEQIVNFQDSQTAPQILVNQDLVDKMAPTQQAALIVHEALYTYLRTKFGETNSIRTRRAVGFVFAGQSFAEFDSVIYKKDHVLCQAAGAFGRTDLYFYLDATGAVNFSSGFYRGVPNLGLYPATVDAEKVTKALFYKGLKDLVMPGACRPQRFPDHLAFDELPFPGQGPADFQRQGWLRVECHNGRYALTIEEATPPLTKIPLVCRFVSSGDSRQ